MKKTPIREQVEDDVIHSRHAGHVFVTHGFDAGQQGDFFRELFDNGQGARIEYAVFGRVVVEHPDNNQVPHTKTVFDHIVVMLDRVVGRDHSFGVTLKAELPHLDTGERGAGHNQRDDRPAKTDDGSKDSFHLHRLLWRGGLSRPGSPLFHGGDPRSVCNRLSTRSANWARTSGPERPGVIRSIN